MSIQWFPGHMNKARRLLATAVKESDVVIEVLDARLPASSRNPMLAEICGDAPRVVVLNKADLADPEATEAWLEYTSRTARFAPIAISASIKGHTRRIPNLCRRLVDTRRRPGKLIRALVVGIPNVGKSTLINSLAGRRAANVGDVPAITRAKQRIDIAHDLSLWDTPGVLWPNLEDQEGAYRLAASGAIRDTAMDYRDVALFTAGFLLETYPEAVATRFRLKDLPEDGRALVSQIGRRRGCLERGGGIDLQRASEILLRELRSGRLGRISLERPPGSAADRPGPDA